MRVVLLTPQDLRVKGGPTTTIKNLRRSLRSLGCKVYVACPGPSYLGLRIPAGPLRRIPAVLAILMRIRPDVVHVHSSLTHALSALAYRLVTRRDARVVFTLHTQPVLKSYLKNEDSGEYRLKASYRGLRFRVCAALLSRFATTTSVSRSIVRNLNAHTDLRIRATVIPSGVSARGTLTPRSHGSRIEIVSIGVFSWDWKVKGHLLGIEAIRKLVDLGEDVSLSILGDGPLRSVVEARIDALSLKDRVELAGNVDDVRAYLREADIYLHTGLNEGCSIALLEAMAEGLPIVAVDAGGNAELVHHGVSGLLVEADARRIAHALLALIEDPEESARLGRAAADAAKGYSWENVALAYRDLYR